MGDMCFGHYRLQRLLGSGATGRVWRAYDTRTEREVALKVLAVEAAADPAFRQRFTREARLAAQLRGPHTVRVHSFGELDGRLYLDMELIEGIDGAALLRREIRLAPGPAVRVITQAAAALDAAHRIGLVHRDVKPSNLMVTPTGAVYLIDFGIASRVGQPPITATGHMVGTLGYAAPERFTGTADARSDQYSLACVLYELLTGQRPFGDGDAPQQVRAHLMTTPPAVSDLVAAAPTELDAVIARAMAKDPSRRWSSAGEFAAAAYAAVTRRDMPTVDTAPTPIPIITSALIGTTVPNQGTHHASLAYSAPPTTRTDDHTRTPVAPLAETTAGHVHSVPALSPRQSSHPRPVTSMRVGPRLAFVAAAGLCAVLAGALYLDRPSAAETDAAIPATTTIAPSLPPALPDPVAPRGTAPVAGQQCDPTVQATGIDSEGVSLNCTRFGGNALWTQVPPPVPVDPTTEETESADHSFNPGIANDGGPGNSGHGNKPKSKEKEKPRKPDK
ncbi:MULTISPECIES: serine/threonine-protein kinase [Nocardia]|uniref:serine/threonine-protein kinase n=1 Tax=Nocardia TaxID=1817 RepID=UPI0013006B68|nr:MULTISPECIES: serine/threonine-protein kinase [Nocardia]